MRNENRIETAAFADIFKVLKSGKVFKGGATPCMMIRNGVIWCSYGNGSQYYAFNRYGLTIALMKEFNTLPSEFLKRFRVVSR